MKLIFNTEKEPPPKDFLLAYFDGVTRDGKNNIYNLDTLVFSYMSLKNYIKYKNIQRRAERTRRPAVTTLEYLLQSSYNLL